MVSTPAIGLMVTGGLIVLGNIAGILMNLLGMGMSGMQGLGGMDDLEWLAPMMSGTFAIISSIIGLGIGGFVVWGAMQMKQLHGYVLSIVTCILPMIPCFSSCCCLLGLAFGIWGLVLLLKPEVKAAFS